MELKQNNTYIFKSKFDKRVIKGKVLELTKTTIQVINLDNDITFRNQLDDFGYEAIECVEDLDKKIRDMVEIGTFNKGFFKFEKYEFKKTGCHNIGPCFCDGSCSKTLRPFWSGE